MDRLRAEHRLLPGEDMHASHWLLLPIWLTVGCGGSERGLPSPTPAPASPNASRGTCLVGEPSRFVGGVPSGFQASTSSSSSGVTLTEIGFFAVDVTTDGTNLFWTLVNVDGTEGSIVSAPIRGGEPTLLADERGEGAPSRLSPRGGRLLWLETKASDWTLARVMAADLDGSNPKRVTDFEPIADVAFDSDGTAYAVEGAALLRIDTNTGAREELASNIPVGLAGPGSVAVDDRNVYALSPASLAVAPKEGGTATLVSTTGAVPGLSSSHPYPAGSLAAGDSAVVWSLSPASYDPPAHVFSMPAVGGTPTDLGATAFHNDPVQALRVQAPWIYFGGQGGGLYRMPVTGGSPQLIVPFTAWGDPLAGYDGSRSTGVVALSGRIIYWGGYDNTYEPTVFCVAE